MAMSNSVSNLPPERGAGEPAARTVLLAGASGLVGREILRGLLADASVAHVHCLARRPVVSSDPRVTSHIVDLKAPGALPAADEAFIALGTTIKVAGSQDAFRAVDYDAVVGFARAAHAAGVQRIGVVSAMGADTKSRIFYSRVKGEAEHALRQIGFSTLVIARPSMLSGDREALGQPVRGGEKLATRISELFRPLIPANYSSVDVRKVAAALLTRVRTGKPGEETLLSGDLQRF